MKVSSYVILMLSLITKVFSQSYSISDFGNVSKEAFSIQSPLINESTDAVIMGDIGSVTF